MILAFIAALIAVNAVLVLLEFALMRVRPARIEILARQGNVRALAVQEILGRLDEYLAAIQLCIAIISLALGAAGEPAVKHALDADIRGLWASMPPHWRHGAAFALAVAILAGTQVVLAELVPRAVAIHFAEPIALAGARPLRWIAMVMRAPIKIAAACSKSILRVFGMKPAAEADHVIGVDEMRVLLGETQEKGALPLERLILLENLFDFGSAKVTDAMRPKEEVAVLSLARPWAENLERIRQRRFTRYPLCETDDLDSAVGYVHLKDLIMTGDPAAPDLRRLRRDLFETTDGESLERLVKTMPDRGVHLALVRDGGGHATGILALEDIIEELIGEISDEFGRSRGWDHGEIFSRAIVDANVPAVDRRGAIHHLLARMKTARPELDDAAAFAAVWERELKFASAIGRGVIVPHARIVGLPEPIVAVGRFAKPAAFPAPDGVPVRIAFLILTPAEIPLVQLTILQRIASLVTNENLRRKLWRAKTDDALLEILRTADTLLAS